MKQKTSIKKIMTIGVVMVGAGLLTIASLILFGALSFSVENQASEQALTFFALSCASIITGTGICAAHLEEWFLDGISNRPF